MILRRFLHPRVCAVSCSGFVVTTAHYLTCATLPLLARARAASRMPEILKRQHHKIDWLGAFLVVSGVVMLELPLTWGGQQYKWSDTPVIVTFALAGPLLIAFFYSQVRHTARRVVWAAGGATCACGVSVLLCGCTVLMRGAFVFVVVVVAIRCGLSFFRWHSLAACLYFIHRRCTRRLSCLSGCSSERAVNAALVCVPRFTNKCAQFARFLHMLRGNIRYGWHANGRPGVHAVLLPAQRVQRCARAAFSPCVCMLASVPLLFHVSLCEVSLCLFRMCATVFVRVGASACLWRLLV